MKLITPFQIAFFLFLLGCNSSKNSTEQHKFEVSGHIENNRQYIGGARPPQDLLDQLAIYQPSSEQQFYVKNNANVVITNFTTDSNGNYSIQIPAGNYVVFRKEKYDYEQSISQKSNCAWVKVPDFSMNVTENRKDYNFKFTVDWNSCTEPRP